MYVYSISKVKDPIAHSSLACCQVLGTKTSDDFDDRSRDLLQSVDIVA